MAFRFNEVITINFYVLQLTDLHTATLVVPDTAFVLLISLAT